ncbi:MAG: VWA domain-containing protein [Muricauda sp.]|nr:VWA domain-containing protein [Allomuricauda sp.]MBA4746872.1 VWA domain-containing protein [Allomuricauda sp.]
MKKNYCAPLHKLIPFLTLFLIIGCSTTETPIDENVLDDDEETVIDNPDDSGNNSDSGEEVAPTDFYRFTTYQTSTADPFDVNVLFQVSDSMFRGVPNLMIEDLRITENDEESPIDESKATLFDRNSFELEMRTALLIDVSNSIQTDFVTLKEELKTLIDGALPFQEIAIYTFSSTTELVQDYSTDKEQLKGTIDNLQLGTGSTDFYGAVVTAANSFTNGFVENEVTVGNLIIFTDGDDTQASNTFTAAKEALIDKNAYVVGLSSADLDEDNIKNLFGEYFYFPSETIGSVNENFGLIQTEIENYANSIYLLNYETPKRGDNNHYLKVYHKENSNEETDQYAVGEFTSTGFYEPVAPSAATLISPNINDGITNGLLSINPTICQIEFQIGKSIDSDSENEDIIVYELFIGESPEEMKMDASIEYNYSDNPDEITFVNNTPVEVGKKYYWKVKTNDNDSDDLYAESELGEFEITEGIIQNLIVTNENITDLSCSSINKVGNLLLAFTSTENVDLTPLNSIKEIGSLKIQNYLPSNWTPTSALASLEQLDEIIVSGYNGGVLNFENLYSLEEFKGIVLIDNNENLKRIIGDLPGGEVIDGFLYGSHNPKIVEINSFNNVKEIKTFMSFETSSNNANNASTPFISFKIENQPNLEIFNAFNSLENYPAIAVGSLNLHNNPKLKIFNSLNNISILKTAYNNSIVSESSIHVTENPVLEDISVYGELTNFKLTSVWIENHISDLNINFLSGIESIDRIRLANVNKLFINTNNTINFDSFWVEGNLENLLFNNKASFNSLRLDSPNYEAFNGINSILNSNSITSLESISLVEIQQRDLNISFFNSLSNLNSLVIINSTELETIDGLDRISDLGSLSIRDCSKIKNLVGIGNLSPNIISVQNCESFNDLGALSNLSELEIFRLANCGKVVNLEGLNSIRNIEYLALNDNSNLTSLKGLGDGMSNLNLTTLLLYRNPLLNDYCDLKTDFTNLSNNSIITNNLYNPTFEELTSGNCKQ